MRPRKESLEGHVLCVLLLPITVRYLDIVDNAHLLGPSLFRALPRTSEGCFFARPLKASICSWTTFAVYAPAFLAAGCRRAVVAGC